MEEAMELKFYSDEVPVAFSMFALAQRAPKARYQPFQKYMCCWAAFNNIYTTVASYDGHYAELKKNDDGTIAMRQEGHVSIAKVNTISERRQIELAFEKFSEELMHGLIIHENTRFFVYRTPSWRGSPISQDASGQELNGVINVGHTVNSDYPIWSPIDTKLYESYVVNHHDTRARKVLAKQIVNVLYTVRNNLFHGGKREDDGNDFEVVEKAMPILSMVVSSFLAAEAT
jgi:hypothetical protein